MKKMIAFYSSWMAAGIAMGMGHEVGRWAVNKVLPRTSSVEGETK